MLITIAITIKHNIMAIIRNKIIFLVSQRKCFTTNKNTITLDYIIICRIYIGCNPIVF